MQILLFYIPVGTVEDARQLGQAAVENKLAACANFQPIQSIYPWKGMIQHDKEVVLLLKTLPQLEQPLRAFIREQHTYDLPCIMSWAVTVNDEYGEWIKECVTG